MTKKNDDLLSFNDALSVTTSIAYTKREIDKLKKVIDSLQEDTVQEKLIVEYVEGPIGPAGPRGPIGSRGERGEQGPKGDKGDRGERGPQGDTGPQGIQGIEGRQGLQGKQGVQGEKGEKGNIGEQGPKGDKGDKGDRGDTGEQGLQGIKGDKGDKGDRGEKGDSGEKGKDGKDGLPGAKGERGEKGERGTEGLKGPKGDKGDPGEKGEKGDPGEQGPKGDPGKDADYTEIQKDINEFKNVLQKDVVEYKNKVNAVISKGFGGGSSGGGEVKLRYLDDVDTTNLSNNKYLKYNSTTQKFEFANVESIEGTITGITIKDEGELRGTVSELNFVGFNVSSVISDNTAIITVTGSEGSGATSNSLNVIFDNNSATTYKFVTLNSNAQTVLASASDINVADRILGVLDENGETVTSGLIENNAWTWTPGQSLYLGLDGNVVTTSTVDGAAFSLKIGYAISATQMFVKIGTPVIL